MKLKAIVTNYGAYLMHSESCPVVDFDWDHHGIREYDLESSSLEDSAEQVRLAENNPQRLVIFAKRLIWHHCVKHNISGVRFKVS